MNAAAWIALASLAAFILIQLIATAFMAGGVYARIKRLEADQSGANLLALQVSALNATVKGFETQLEHFSDTLRDIMGKH